jgi:hypothetical protein
MLRLGGRVAILCDVDAYKLCSWREEPCLSQLDRDSMMLEDVDHACKMTKECRRCMGKENDAVDNDC